MGARAPPEFGGSEKGQSLNSGYRSLAITTNTPGFKKLSTALLWNQVKSRMEACYSELILVIGCGNQTSGKQMS